MADLGLKLKLLTLNFMLVFSKTTLKSKMRLKPSSSLRTHFLRLGQSGCMKSYLDGVWSREKITWSDFYSIFSLVLFLHFCSVLGSHYEVQTTYYMA